MTARGWCMEAGAVKNRVEAAQLWVGSHTLQAPTGLAGAGAAPPGSPSCPRGLPPASGMLCPSGPRTAASLCPGKGEARPAVLEAGLQAEWFLKIRWERGRTKGKWEEWGRWRAGKGHTQPLGRGCRGQPQPGRGCGHCLKVALGSCGKHRAKWGVNRASRGDGCYCHVVNFCVLLLFIIIIIIKNLPLVSHTSV